MESKLESHLSEYEKSTSIKNDTELVEAIEEIIAKEISLPPEDRDYDLINEAVEMVLSLHNADLEDLEDTATNISENFITSKRKINKKQKHTRTFRWKLIVRLAAVITVIAAIIATCYAFGLDLISMTREVFLSLSHKTEYSDGTHDVIVTDSVRKYNTFKEMIDAEQITGLLENDYLNNSEIVDYVRFQDFGLNKSVLITLKGEYSGEVEIIIPTDDSGLPDELEKIGILNVYLTSYDDVFQAEWLHNGNYYCLTECNQENLFIILNEFKESE